MARFVEALALLTVDEKGIALAIQKDVLDCAWAGAALLDLAFAGRIDTDLQGLVVVDRSPTGQPSLDRLLGKIADRQSSADARSWFHELSGDEAASIRVETMAALAATGETTAARRLPWRFGLGDAAIDRNRRAALAQRVAAVLLSDEIPDPWEIALISLLDACDVLAEVLPAAASDGARERIEQLRRLDLIGREVASAVADIERTAILAVRARSARFRRLLLGVAVGATAAGLLTLALPRIPIPDRFGATIFERLWSYEAWQRWSGYALLAFSVVGLLALLSARIKAVARAGGAHWWRLAHIGFGASCLLLLFVHTGFRLGVRLNAALMASYLAVLLLGGLTGIVSYGARPLRKLGATPKLRRQLLRLHWLAVLPLPALIVVHILVVYLY